MTQHHCFFHLFSIGLHILFENNGLFFNSFNIMWPSDSKQCQKLLKLTFILWMLIIIYYYSHMLIVKYIILLCGSSGGLAKVTVEVGYPNYKLTLQAHNIFIQDVIAKLVLFQCRFCSCKWENVLLSQYVCCHCVTVEQHTDILTAVCHCSSA